MIRKILSKIKEDYREFITARKRIEELEYYVKLEQKINADLWKSNICNLTMYMKSNILNEK